MEDLVLTIEQCRHLLELGLDMTDAKIFHIYESTPQERDGEYYEENEWHVRPDNIYNLNYQPNIIEYVPTYTLQEIIEKCPMVNNCYPMVSKNSFDSLWIAGYKPETSFKGDTAVEAAYNLLCYVIENIEYKIR